jgi:outer membrane protein insertion porin family
MNRILLLLTVFGLVGVYPSAAASAADDPEQRPEIRVRLIEVAGNQRLEAATILAKVKTQEGDLFDPERLREDLKAIHRMGYFNDVRVRTEPFEGGLKVVFEVEEQPLISEVRFVGNTQIMTEKLKERSTLKAQSFYQERTVSETVQKMREAYEEDGYYNTEVVPVVYPDAESKDRLSVTLYIKEGEKARVRDLEFDGNKAFTDEELEKALETRRYRPWSSWMTGRGYYREPQLDTDLERLKDFYMNDGYLDIQVGRPAVEIEDQASSVRVPVPVLEGDLDYEHTSRAVRARIRVTIVEGEQYHLDEVRFEGNTVLTEPELHELLKLKKGEIFARNRLRSGVSAIHEKYGEKGYFFASVQPQFAADPASRTVDLTLKIQEQSPVTVREIRISGNDKTRDKVIRREMRVNEQELINTKLLRRSFQRLNNLNFFETIEINPERVADDQVDLGVHVKEKSTGALTVGGAYNSVDRFTGTFEITQGNLFGRGQLLRAKVDTGDLRTTYSLTFREPYLMDRPVSMTTDLYNQVRDFETYDERKLGGDVILGKSFTERVSGSVSYTWESIRLFNVDLETSEDDDTIAPQLIQDQFNEEPKSITSSIGASLVRDTRDVVWDPKEGSRLTASVEYARSFLGGTNDFIKLVGDATRYFPLWGDTALSLHARVGTVEGIGDEIPIGERFYVGGINTVRGFKFGHAGPMVDDEVVGGTDEIILNAEYLITLVEEARIKGVVFYDIGRAFDQEVDGQAFDLSKLRKGAGFGFRWISPIGPLRLEWGYNLEPEADEDRMVMEFTIGSLF